MLLLTHSILISRLPFQSRTATGPSVNKTSFPFTRPNFA